MKIALAQINSVIGDFEGNAAKILAMVREVAAGSSTSLEAGPSAGSGTVSGGSKSADLVVFPELALCGYPPMDLLDQDAFVAGSLEALRRLQRELPHGVAVAFGYVDRNRSGAGRPLRNVVGVIRDGALVFTQAKTLLPTYDVFDEARYFEPAASRQIFDFEGMRLGFAICEDIWWESPPVPGLHYAIDPVKELLDAGAELLVVPSASPFGAGKLAIRRHLSAKASKEGRVPTLYCNAVGANDSLVFDGRSFVLDTEGELVASLGWDEGLLVVDSRDLLAPPHAAISEAGEAARGGWSQGPTVEDPMAEIEKALVIGIRDYMAKCGFRKACLGLSGGIDSALVAVLAAEAIGSENLACISMPSRFSSEGSIADSAALCDAIGSSLLSLPIEGPFGAYLSLLEPHFEGLPFGLAEENLQARIRGALLMSWSNKFEALLLTTGNKSELATGYCTLYGDMCGALAPIGDLLKTEVYALSRFINARYAREGRVPPIPESTLVKPPSAELRPDQTDQDSLPPYEVLDAILRLYIVENLALDDIVGRGYDPALVAKIIGMVARAEYKRRQSAPVIKVSARAFGTGRRMPIARAIHESRGRTVD
ncbi:MAG TPA: NAD+ synthase [Rectinemataceae bacterium]|nr:NAD+ synthase [Rectinemataceae bacterium]